MTISIAGSAAEKALLRAISEAAHDKRLAGFRKSFRLAVRDGLDGWALLCKGYEYWVTEEYDRIDNSLLEACETLAYTGQSLQDLDNYWALRKLLFAHGCRRKAGEAIRQLERMYSDRRALLCLARKLVSRASHIYSYLIERQACSARIKAVAANSLGNIELIRARVAREQDNPERPRYDPRPRWREASKWYRDAAAIAKGGGFSYAPPHSRLAALEFSRALHLAKQGGARKRQKLHLCGAIEHANKAIGLGHGQYAPPLVHKARALYYYYYFGLARGRPVPRKQVAALLGKAIAIAPFDSAVREEVEGFADAIGSDASDGTDTCGFRRQVRLAYPIAGTQASLKACLRPREAERTSGSGELLVLKRWSSYTPLLVTEDRETIGGGYLLVWRGHRMALDPGVGFIRNMHRYGYCPAGLDTVVMTHQHVDHTADFEPLLGFFKEYSKMQGMEGGSSMKRVSVLLTPSGMSRWRALLLRDDHIDEDPVAIRAGGRAIRLGPAGHITIVPTPVYGHQDIVDERVKGGRSPVVTGVGLLIRLLSEGNEERVVGITSDTGYLSEHHRRASKAFMGCDIVVLHVSTVSDLSGDLPPDRVVVERAAWREAGCPGRFYRKHLGFWGTVCFIRDLIAEGGRSDRTILLSEFGEEMLASRPAVVDEMRKILRTLGPAGEAQSERIHIADVGTCVELTKAHVTCHCGNNACRRTAMRSFELELHRGDRTLAHRPWGDRSIIHLCSQHAMRHDTRGYWPILGEFGAISEIGRADEGPDAVRVRSANHLKPPPRPSAGL